MAEAGFFKDPPPRRVNGDFVSYPGWPESRYLARMAPVAPARVADVIGRIPGTDNVSVHEDLARAVIHLDAGSMARWATGEARWISRQPRIEHPLDEALGAVVERLAGLGMTAAAMRLARSLLAIRCVVDSERLGSVRELTQPYESGVQGSNREPTHEEDRVVAEMAASVAAQLASRIVGPLSPYEYRRFVDRRLPVLLTHGGIKALEMLCDVFESAVESDKLRRYDRVIWRPAIEPHVQNGGSADVSDVLVDAIRDASVELVDSGVALKTVVDSLGRRGAPMFKRMILQTIRPDR